ncbi:ABC transporter substrate-binding protein [Xylanibacillus composti]|uniref:Peptide ABC transporter substrate-binding protein n=1 Tax=Xylanibacillus composti TaxID=1572762 RepID=A0A8J4M1S8_9BACL|nr:nickel ABC transporter substrate-binding protein [Xylanibacillus composti]MDT9723588.1 ABC transporter substrate-binding protein [Xylanibacillus composti]GIQ68375.1 peptide ABC transporter substrate-binding protein [Xylanibacillus composti]
MNRKRCHTFWLKSSMVCMAFVLFLTACAAEGQNQYPAAATTGPDQSGEGKSITIIHSLPVDTLDPHNGWISVRAGVAETLVRLDENMQVTPWLAATWEAKDPLTWVFTLRDNIRFQDGTKLDAAAAKASFERGIADSRPLAASLKIASIEANGQVLTFRTTEPHPAFPTELVHPTASVISIAAEEASGKEAFNKAPVGTGPFKVTGFIPGKEVTLIRHEHYWDELAKLEEVTIQFNADANVRTLAFQSKQADIVYHLAPESLDLIEKDQELDVESVTSLRTHYFTYNPASDHVADLRVRQALDKLIDRDAIVEEIMLGHAMPANGPFHALLPFGSKKAAQKLDPDGALKLLESAGYTKGPAGIWEKDGKPLKLKLIAFTGINPELPLIPLLVQSEAAKVGIAIEIVSVEYPEVYIKDNTDWDMSTASYLTSPRGDGGSFLNSAYTLGGSYNPAHIHLEELEAILRELNDTRDVPKRHELTRSALEIIHEEMPHSYIIHPNILVGIHQRVTNWKPGAEEFYIVTNKLDVQ